MGKTSREKGKRGEREVAEILRSHGFPGRRTAQYCGNTGDASDVVGLDGYHIEVKRCETIRIMDWMEQAEREANGDVPLVVFRKSRGKWYAVLAFEAFLARQRPVDAI